MRSKRWLKRILAGLLAAGTASGCKQQLFLEPGDYKDAVLSALPRGLDTNPHDTLSPSQVNRLSADGPGTVLDPNRPAKMMTLQECIAIALEQGNVGSQNPLGFGNKNEQIDVFNGQTVSGADTVRVFALDPSLAAVTLERSLSKFDVRWVSSMSWQKVDQPTAAQFLSFQNSRDAANLVTTLAKPLPTGGVAGITFSTDYSKFANQTTGAQFVNPNYTPRVQFTFEQPLLRLFGVEANQLSSQHPGSQLLNVQPSGGQGTEGILISRIRVDQAKAQFDQRINYLLVNVETAYWNLYAAYYNLYAQEEGLRQAFEGYRFIKTKVDIGSNPSQNLDQSRAQFERFRRQVYDARRDALEAERQLRGLIGVRSDDGTRIVPIDQPNEAEFRPDFYESANTALENRPELLQARQALKAQQLNLLLQKNLRQPDFRLFSQYDVAGLGTRLDGDATLPGGGPGNALASLGANQFNSWTVGFRLDVPIGFRDANGLVRESQLNLARTYFQLRDAEMKALEYLVQQYRRVIHAYTVIGPAREERKALQLYLGKTKELIDIGRWDENLYQQQYLTVQRDLANAIAAEFRAIADYNSALAALELAKGTIQQYNNVSVNEGPLPSWVQKKAADHIRERTESALKLRERDVVPPPGGPGVIGGAAVGPAVGSPALAGLNLPPFAEKRDPVPESLPAPTPLAPKREDNKMPGGGLGMSPVPLSRPDAGGVIPAGDYFQPTGTAGVPRVRTGGTGSPVPLPASPPTPPVSLPAGTGLAPLPIPPVGSTLPVPPPGPVPTVGEFGPPPGNPAIPGPPATRYPVGGP